MMLGKGKIIRVFRGSLAWALIGTLALLAGCANTIVVKGNIPTPLVEKVPLNGAISYTDEFRSYIYNESEKKRALKSLDFTEAQITMFDSIFGGLMNLVAADAQDRDLTIEPEILELQYTAPSETKLNQYEVWIKYRLKLIDAENKKIADWIIKGYGKTPTALLGSAASGFNSAANIALRDVGAQLSIGFPNQSKIKALVNNGIEQAPNITEEPEIDTKIDTKAEADVSIETDSEEPES